MRAFSPVCPVDSTHGKVRDWSGEWGWYCPHTAHDGLPGKPETRTRAFFTTAEIEAGTLLPRDAVGSGSSSPDRRHRRAAAQEEAVA